MHIVEQRDAIVFAKLNGSCLALINESVNTQKEDPVKNKKKNNNN